MALLGALSDKAQGKKIIVLSDIGMIAGKTKNAEKLLSGRQGANERWLLIVGEKEKKVARAFRNLTAVTVMRTNDLNTYCVLANQELILTPESISEVDKLYGPH
jgi:ribosomal protein L4